MAIRKMTDGVSGYNNKTPFPRDRYSICCVEEDMEISKSKDNPMLKRQWEVVSPETVALGDRTISVAGVKFTTYTTTKVRSTKEEVEAGEPEWNEEKSDKAFGRLRDDLLLVGFDPDGEIDDENPPCFMKGKTVEAILYAREDVARKSPTPEQAKKRQPGDPIKDAEGNDVVTYQIQLESILGLSEKQVGVPY